MNSRHPARDQVITFAIAVAAGWVAADSLAPHATAGWQTLIGAAVAAVTAVLMALFFAWWRR